MLYDMDCAPPDALEIGRHGANSEEDEGGAAARTPKPEGFRAGSGDCNPSMHAHCAEVVSLKSRRRRRHEREGMI